MQQYQSQYQPQTRQPYPPLQPQNQASAPAPPPPPPLYQSIVSCYSKSGAGYSSAGMCDNLRMTIDNTGALRVYRTSTRIISDQPDWPSAPILEINDGVEFHPRFFAIIKTIFPEGVHASQDFDTCDQIAKQLPLIPMIKAQNNAFVTTDLAELYAKNAAFVAMFAEVSDGLDKNRAAMESITRDRERLDAEFLKLRELEMSVHAREVIAGRLEHELAERLAKLERFEELERELLASRKTK